MREDRIAIDIDYRWRKTKVTYIVVVLLLFVASCFTANLYNSRHVCVPNANWGWQGLCGPARIVGHGISDWYLALEFAVLIAGYYFVLPRIYRYLTPPHNLSQNE